MILVVDDQPVVLEVVAAMLRHSVLEIPEASGGVEALQVPKSRAEVTILPTGYDMPLPADRSWRKRSWSVGPR